MTTPVTSRLDRTTVAALDKAVHAGLAPSRGALVARAVAEWLDRHSEDAVAESYRRRYAEEDPAHDEMVAKIGAFSAAACLATQKT